MCSTSVLCPLCAVPSFGSIDALQQRLIKAANGPLACPFANCKELFLGLDKLTIHLFSHTSLMSQDAPAAHPVQALPVPPLIAVSAPKRRAKRTRAKPVAAPPPPPVTPTPPASCDICEFSFRNTELRDMHIRLVHENAESEQKQSQPKQGEPVNKKHKP